MASPKEMRNAKLGEKMVKALEARHFEAYYCATKEEAKDLALSLIPEGSSITWGGTETIAEIGLKQALKEGNYNAYDRDDLPTMEEKQELYRKAFSMDVFLASTNAISEDGVLVNIDGTGNRVAAMTFGPKKVIVIAGMNKVAKTVEDAVVRARTVAAPINCQRFASLKTGCNVSGACENCKSADSICAYFSEIRISRPPKRVCVILVGEELGF